MTKNRTLWLGVVIAVVFAGIFFYGTDLQAIGAVFRTTNYIYLIPALILYFIGVMFRAARWHFLLRSIKPIGYSRLFQVTVIGFMANDLLPFRIGEVVRAYILGETENISKASTLVTIVLERIFDGVTLLLFVGIASFFLPLEPWVRTLLLVGSIVFAALVVILVMVASFRDRFDHLIHRVVGRLPAHWGERSLKLIDAFFQGLSVLRNPFDALIAFGLSILAWLFEAGMYAVLARGFSINLSFPVFVLTTAVSNLVTIVPSTPGYVGVFDAAAKYVLTFFGVPPNIAASYTILLHAVLVIPVVLLGLVFMWRLGLTLGQLQKTGQGNITLENA